MQAKKNSITGKNIKTEKKNVIKTEKKNENKEKSSLQKVLILQKSIKLKNDDKMLEKVEKYVDKNREKTSQEIMERKTSRPVRQYQEGDLEVMISKISIQTQSKKKTTENSRGILYMVYIIIIIAILILAVKYFFAGKMPQIS